MEGLVAFGAAFGLVALLELGDKTQLATISMAARHPWRPVFAGAAAGLVAATGLGAAAGAAIAVAMAGALTWVQVAGGAAFIAFGLWEWFRQEEEDGQQAETRSVVAQAFSLTFLAEMGDKTQLAVVVLAASESAPLSVFAGAGAALVALSALSVFIGVQMAARLRPERVKQLSTAIFVGAGALLIAEALLGA